MRVGIVGAGVFGLAVALELAARGHAVTVVERDTVPAARAEGQWRRWQDRAGAAFYFPIGHLLVTRGFAPGSRAHASHATLTARGARLQVLTAPEARRRYPQIAYGPDDAVLYDPWGGYLASGEAIAALARLARADGVALRERTPVRAVEERPDAAYLVGPDGTLAFDRVVVAAGVWLGLLVPALGPHLRLTRQGMAFFAPDDPAGHRPGPLPVWAIDAPGDAWYGHPLADGRVKVADNPLGEPAAPDGHREASPGFADRARSFVGRWLPGLACGALAGTRSCLYDNTPDGDFLIDHAPGMRRVLVAGGGSGHGFKFGGVLGPLIADALEEKDNPLGAPFRCGPLRFGGRLG